MSQLVIDWYWLCQLLSMYVNFLPLAFYFANHSRLAFETSKVNFALVSAPAIIMYDVTCK